MQDALIEQIVSRVSSLTDAQVFAMNSATLPQEAIIEANDVAGEETRAIMTQFADSVDAGVYSVARTAILGIMAKGKVGDEVSTILVRAWTDIVEPLDEGTAEPYTTIVMGDQGQGGEPVEVTLPTHDTLHTPTEEELNDLGAPETSRYGFGIAAEPSAVLEGEVKDNLEFNFEETKKRAFPEWDGHPEYHDGGLSEVEGRQVHAFTWTAEVPNAFVLAVPLTTEEVIAKETAEEVGTPALVDAPLDIQEGDIQVPTE